MISPNKRANGHSFRRDYFDDMYRSSPDPWGFDSSWYERRKFELTLAALPRPRYQRAFEPGCANGALTAMLADRCDQLYSYDFVAETVERCQQRLANSTHVNVSTATFPETFPDGTGDLIVLSEIAYYLTDSGRVVALRSILEWLRPGGHLVAVHYTGNTNYPMHGHDVGLWLDRSPDLEQLCAYNDDKFELVVWQHSPPCN